MEEDIKKRRDEFFGQIKIGDVSALHFEERAFGGVAEIMLRSQRPPRRRAAGSAWLRERAEVHLPARIDLAGGWSFVRWLVRLSSGTA